MVREEHWGGKEGGEEGERKVEEGEEGKVVREKRVKGKGERRKEERGNVQTPMAKAKRPAPVKMFFIRYGWRARIRAAVWR